MLLLQKKEIWVSNSWLEFASLSPLRSYIDQNELDDWPCIIIIIIIIIIIYSLRVFFTSVLADGFSLEFEWQQVSPSLQDSSQYYGRSQ